MHPNASIHKPSFWQRQFAQDFTPAQTIFDFLFGIVGPMVCLIFDPFVFTGSRHGFLASPLVPYRVLAYLGIGASSLILTLWLVFGTRINTGHGFFAGVLLLGALVAFGIGLILLPFSVLGLLVVIGIFGFIPFLTAFVYLRNGLRALCRMRPFHSIPEKTTFASSVILGLAIVAAVPAIAQWQTSRIVSESVQSILTGDAPAVEQGVQHLQTAFWCNRACYDDIVTAYAREHDPGRQAILAKAYWELTGQSIRRALPQFID